MRKIAKTDRKARRAGGRAGPTRRNWTNGVSFKGIEVAGGQSGWAAVMLPLLLVLQVAATASSADAFAFLKPSVTISSDDRHRLDRGEPIARVLSGSDLEVAVFAAIPVDVNGDRLVAWMRRIDQLKKSSYVQAIGRFSDPPRIEDLAGLVLDDEDLSAIRACRPHSCALKLSDDEMRRLQVPTTSGETEWKAAVQLAFRQVVLERVKAYLANGRIAAYDDQKTPVLPATRFGLLLDHSAFLTSRVPWLVEHLRGYPQTASAGVESFMYWSKERLGNKAVVSVTHVNILRGREAGAPDALVAARQVFATHYVNASLGVTAILRGTPGGPNYLAYVNRSELDVLGGMFGGLVRLFVQRRLKSEAADVLRGLRQRLESGEPGEESNGR